MKQQIKILWLIYSAILFFILFFLLKKTFFFHDEWVFLNRLIKSPVDFIFTQHNGHFMPVFNLIYFIEYSFFKLNYQFYQLFVLIFHFANAYLLYVIVAKVTKNKYFGLLSFFIFITSSMYWEILFSASTFQIVLFMFFVGLSIVYYINFIERKELKYLTFSSIFTLISIFTWGGGFIYPFSFLLIYIFKKILKEKVSIQELIFSLTNIIISILTFFIFVKQASGSINIKQVVSFMLDSIRWLVVSFYTTSPGLLKIFVLITALFIILFRKVFFVKTIRDQFLFKIKESRSIFFFSLANLLLIYLLISFSRYSFGSELARSSRYTYVPLFFLIIVNLIILNGIYSLLGKNTKIFLAGYLMLLFLGNVYFFKIYYTSWINTISIPHLKTYSLIINSKSSDELDNIELPGNFTRFLEPKDIYFVYKQSIKE